MVPSIVRTKDLLKVKGMLINPTALLEAVRAVPGVDEYQGVPARVDAAAPFSMAEMIARAADK